MPSSNSILKSTSDRRDRLPAILAAAAALLVYAITVGGSYVYDDTILHEDPRFTHVDQWRLFWTQAYMPGAVDRLYRPLTCMTFAIEYALHGDRPWIYHLVNLLLHASVAAAVAEFARRLMGFRAACIAGLLFAVHPVHVEAVAGLVGRAELLCALATFIGLIQFLKPPTVTRIFTISACFVVAILSKEQGILLPAFLLLLIPFRRQLLNQPQLLLDGDGGSPASLLEKHGRAAHATTLHPTSDNAISERGAMRALFAVLCFLTVGYIIFREQLLGFIWDRRDLDWTANPLILSTGVDRVLMPLVLLGRYVMLLIAPLKLSLDYGTHVIGWTVNWRQPWIYLGAATLTFCLLAFMWSIVRRNWAAFFCLASLALSYGMVSNSIILIGTIFGERLMYLPSAFFLILVAALLARLFSPISKVAAEVAAPAEPTHASPTRTFTFGPLCAVVVVLITLASIRSVTYARLWNHPLKLYLADLRDHPLSMHLHGMAADQYIRQGDYRAARAVAEDSLRRLPDCTESYRMAVAADVKLNDFEDAERVLAHPDRRALGLRMIELRRDFQAAKALKEQHGLSAGTN